MPVSGSHRYKVARDTLLGWRPSLIKLPADTDAAEAWVMDFSEFLNLVASRGVDAGIDAYADPAVTTLIKDVRDRLLQYATEAWIKHSPRIVAGMEERLRQIASTTAPTLSTPAASTTGPSRTILLLLGEYVRCVKEGSMTQAEFDKLSNILLSASQDSHRVHLPSVTVSPPTSQTSPPVPSNSERSVPSPSSAAPPAVAHSVESTVHPAQNPVRQAARTATTGLAEPAPARRAALKRPRPGDLMDTSTIPNYTRCEYCARDKVRCAPRVGASPPYVVCARCEDAGRPCIRKAPVRRRRKMQSSGTGGSRLRHAAQPPPPSAPAQEASLLMGGGVSLSQVESTVSVLVWRAELVRATAARESAERQEKFAQERYTEALGRAVAPVATADKPQSKRARTVPAKGKGKAREVVVVFDEVVSDDDSEEDELADTGESEVDEVES